MRRLPSPEATIAPGDEQFKRRGESVTAFLVVVAQRAHTAGWGAPKRKWGLVSPPAPTVPSRLPCLGGKAVRAGRFRGAGSEPGALLPVPPESGWSRSSSRFPRRAPRQGRSPGGSPLGGSSAEASESAGARAPGRSPGFPPDIRRTEVRLLPACSSLGRSRPVLPGTSRTEVPSCRSAGLGRSLGST